ncbi:hypothetical protein F183_A21620 [Bryobacterales bacterium F-183]|nr:hypothetical protein F183_A21620 [Bryobacterales bacterium F-183]
MYLSMTPAPVPPPTWICAGSNPNIDHPTEPAPDIELPEEPADSTPAPSSEPAPAAPSPEETAPQV